MILLNKNEGPYDFSIDIKREIANQLIEQDWNRYPNMLGKELREHIAEHHNLEHDQIFIGNGSSDFIAHLITVYKKHCKRIVYPLPSFELFELCGHINDLECVPWKVNNNMQYDYENYPGKNGSIYIICNPNNPSGDLIQPNFIENQIKNEPNSLFIIDEAYIEFSGKTLIHLINTYKNVFVIRTLSKALGLAGVRLGYGVCHKETAKQLSNKTIPYRLNHFNNIVGKYVFLNYQNQIIPVINRIVENRNNLFKNLEKLFEGTENKVFPSEGNFILFKTNNENLFQQLSEKEIKLGKVKYYPNYYRITVGTKEENKLLLKELKKIISKTKKPSFDKKIYTKIPALKKIFLPKVEIV